MNTQPLIAVDVVPIHFDGENLNIVLGERQYEPFQGKHALPGVLLTLGETLNESAERALRTKVGYTTMTVTPIKQVGAFDNSDRDPRGPTMSILFYGIVRDIIDQPENIVIPTKDLAHLPFDHNSLIEAALNRLAERAFDEPETLKNLLGAEFTSNEAKRLAESLGTLTNPSNFTRFLRGIPFVEETEQHRKGTAGRPEKMWRFKND